MKVAVNASGLYGITKLLASMPGNSARARNSALSTIGYNLKNSAKALIKGNSLGWPQIRNITRIAKKYPSDIRADSRTPSAFIARDNVMGGVARKMWGSLANLLVYSLEKADGILTFGFEPGTYGTKKGLNGKRVANVIGDSVVSLARKLTEGFTYVIGTGPRGDAQRRYFAALGFVFPKGKVLAIPPRPLVGPTFNENKGNIPGRFREKFWERFKKYSGGIV